MIFFIYAFSVATVFLGIFNYIKYTERAHMREFGRQCGKIVYSYINSANYHYFCGNIINQYLIISDIYNGFLEGVIGLEPMVLLYEEEKPKIVEVEKIITVDKLIPVYNETQIIEQLNKLLNPTTKLLEYDKTTTNTQKEETNTQKEDIGDTDMMKNIEQILENEVNTINANMGKPKIFMSKKDLIKKREIQNDKKQRMTDAYTENSTIYDNTENSTVKITKVKVGLKKEKVDNKKSKFK